MKIELFIENFAAQFEETEANEFKSDTKFKELDEWSSLTALSIIAMVEEEYDVNLKGDDIRNALTISDLHEIILKKSTDV